MGVWLFRLSVRVRSRLATYTLGGGNLAVEAACQSKRQVSRVQPLDEQTREREQGEMDDGARHNSTHFPRGRERHGVLKTCIFRED